MTTRRVVLLAWSPTHMEIVLGFMCTKVPVILEAST
jgi:hypothetical protein